MVEIIVRVAHLFTMPVLENCVMLKFVVSRYIEISG